MRAAKAATIYQRGEQLIDIEHSPRRRETDAADLGGLPDLLLLRS